MLCMNTAATAARDIDVHHNLDSRNLANLEDMADLADMLTRAVAAARDTQDRGKFLASLRDSKRLARDVMDTAGELLAATTEAA